MRAKNIPAEDWWKAVAPLDRHAMERVFAEVRRPFAVPERDIEALYIAAAALSKRICQMVTAKPPSPPKARRAEVLRTAVTLGHAIRALQEDGFAAPPMLPPTWLAELQSWATADLRQRGRPKSQANRISLPPLLDLYAVAFGVPPTHTQGGPAARFLKAWRKEVAAAATTSADLQGAPALLPALTESNTLRLIQDWRGDGIRRRIAHKTFWMVVLALDPTRGEIRSQA